MPHKWSKERLLEEYRKLEQRVTGFSRTEQQLIDLTDRLDQELVLHQRLGKFSARALEIRSLEEEVAFSAESLVDIFETQFGVVLAQRKGVGVDQSWVLCAEGANFDAKSAELIRQDVALLKRELINTSEVAPAIAQKTSCFKDLACALCFEFESSSARVSLIGGIRKDSIQTYGMLGPSHRAAFDVFALQVWSVLKVRIYSHEIEQKNEEFSVTIEQLHKTNRELDNFVYSVSHDLRSPLVAIKGAVQILEMTDGMPSVTSKFLNMIIRSVNRLDENVQEILECSRNSRLDVNLTTFNLKALLDSVIEDLNFFMGRAVHVVLQGNADSFIVTDKSRLSTVLKNLIGNAVKYSKPDNEDIKVVVKVDLKPDLLSMDVIDEGIGIPEQSLKSIFDMFYRATTISKGTGLGLYICSQIVEKLDGQISVTSTLGVGSKFSISVPLQTKSYENSFGG